MLVEGAAALSTWQPAELQAAQRRHAGQLRPLLAAGSELELVQLEGVQARQLAGGCNGLLYIISLLSCWRGV
jgi:hypothetical protein